MAQPCCNTLNQFDGNSSVKACPAKTRGKGSPLSSACSKRGEGAQKAFGAFAYGGRHDAFAYRGQEEQEGAGGTQEEKGQESALEHPCSAVFSVKHICVVASRAKWSEVK